MYSSKQNVLELVALMVEFDVKDIVLSPGSRNAPLSQSFATNKYFNCYSVTDERSAGFIALGIAQATRKPVAVCCTSGSALLNILPAVSEAFYQGIPLLVISADRPQEWIGQMDGQTIPQVNMASSIFKKSVHLPDVKDSSEVWFCNRLINEALIALTNGSPKPVHINIPLSEPLFDFSVDELPNVRKVDYCSSNNTEFRISDNLLAKWKSAEKVLIIVGQQFYKTEIEQLLTRLEREKKCVVLSELTSNTPNVGISNFDSILHIYPDNDSLKPDLVIQVGGHIVSKRLKSYIRTNNPKQLWSVTTEPNSVVDTFKCLTTIIDSDDQSFLQALVNTEKVFDSAFADNWKSFSQSVSQQADAYSFDSFSDIHVVKEVMNRLPDCKLQLANSSVVRNAQLFADNKRIKEVHCNRGTSGIEGSMSTAVGFASINGGLTYLMIGDLSFFYDMNALWNNHVSNKLRILVINNGNGQIFNVLPNLKRTDIQETYIAAKHNTSVESWVEDQGFFYLSANDKQTLSNALQTFCSSDDANQAIVLEVFTDSKISEKDLKAYYKHLINIKKHG